MREGATDKEREEGDCFRYVMLLGLQLVFISGGIWWFAAKSEEMANNRLQYPTMVV